MNRMSYTIGSNCHTHWSGDFGSPPAHSFVPNNGAVKYKFIHDKDTRQAHVVYLKTICPPGNHVLGGGIQCVQWVLT